MFLPTIICKNIVKVFFNDDPVEIFKWAPTKTIFKWAFTKTKFSKINFDFNVVFELVFPLCNLHIAYYHPFSI